MTNRPFAGLTYNDHKFKYSNLKTFGAYTTRFATQTKHPVINEQGILKDEALKLELDLYYLANGASLSENDALL